jgi:hypothetical protein
MDYEHLNDDQFWQWRLGDHGVEGTAEDFDKHYAVNISKYGPKIITVHKDLASALGVKPTDDGADYQDMYMGPHTEITGSAVHIHDPLYGDNLPNTASHRMFIIPRSENPSREEERRKTNRTALASMAMANRIQRTGDPNVLPNGRRLTNPVRTEHHIWYDNNNEDEG